MQKCTSARHLVRRHVRWCMTCMKMEVLSAHVALAQRIILAHAVPVRTVGEQAYRIRELRVRFFRADMMFKPSHEVRPLCLPSPSTCRLLL